MMLIFLPDAVNALSGLPFRYRLRPDKTRQHRIRLDVPPLRCPSLQRNTSPASRQASLQSAITPQSTRAYHGLSRTPLPLHIEPSVGQNGVTHPVWHGEWHVAAFPGFHIPISIGEDHRPSALIWRATRRRDLYQSLLHSCPVFRPEAHRRRRCKSPHASLSNNSMARCREFTCGCGDATPGANVYHPFHLPVKSLPSASCSSG